MKRRVRGTGSVEKYKDSLGEWRYRARVVLASGRRVPVGVFRAEREAQIALDDALAKYRAGAAVDISVGITVRQWGASFLDQRDEQGIRGIATERNRWKNLVDASPLADVILAAVVRRDAKQWLAWLQGRRIKYKHAHSRNGKKLSRVTLQNALNLVRKAFDVALDDELVAVNPFAGVRLPRNPGRTYEPWTYLTVEEQHDLVNAVPAEHRQAVRFAISTGLRQGEQWSLRWSDVKDGLVIVRFGSEGQPTKSGKARTVPLLVPARTALIAMSARRLAHDGLVFPAANGGRRDKGEPAGWKEWVRDAGISRNVRWHDLRHTCASSLVAGWWGRKWSLEEVKGMLGHASITTTERYAHLAESEIQRAAKETVGMPAVSPSSPDTIEPTAGATSGIRIPDLRFTKACETVAVSRESTVLLPAGGRSRNGDDHEQAAGDARRHVVGDEREQDEAGDSGEGGSGRSGRARRAAVARQDDGLRAEGPAGHGRGAISVASPAERILPPSGRGTEEEGEGHEQAQDFAVEGLACDGAGVPSETSRRRVTAQEPALTTATVARHAGLSPMLLEASYRDVMRRRAGR